MMMIQQNNMLREAMCYFGKHKWVENKTKKGGFSKFKWFKCKYCPAQRVE